MISMIDILSGAPFWAWLVLAYGLTVGIRGLQPRKISMSKNVLLTGFFLYLSVSSLIHASRQFPSIGIVWLIAAAIGATISYCFLTPPPIAELSDRRGLMVQGSVTSLIIFPIIFMAKFTYGVMVAIAPDMLLNIGFEVVFFTITGLSTGILVGRTTCYLRHYVELNPGS
ncbi:DUF6622 family protein [Gynuella sp.]|uniref:DUF6622 family protein n=1 Tax=Gynuella sp. TaxID=2969146 RepID=UPI003D10A0B9